MDIQAVMDNFLIEEDEAIAVIKKFKAKNLDFLEQFDGALATKDFVAGYEMIHKLKGSAGNLRLNRLYDESVKIESAMRDKQLPESYEQFKLALAEAFKEIDDLK